MGWGAAKATQSLQRQAGAPFGLTSKLDPQAAQSDLSRLFSQPPPICAACRRNRFNLRAASNPNTMDPSPPPSSTPPSMSRFSSSTSEPISRKSMKPTRRRLRSTAVDRGETTGVLEPVELRVAKGVEEGTGYDSDMEVGNVRLPHEQPWGGVHPSVQFVTEFLRAELPKFFSKEGFSTAIYRQDVHFRDPLSSIHGVRGFQLNVFFIRLLFAGGQFVLHDIKPTNRDEVTARWTFILPARFLPWQPVVAFTGVSLFGVDLQQAKLTAHYDYWDNLKGKENEPPSLAAIASVASQIQPLTAFNRPQDQPYLLLRRAKAYEIRQYGEEDTDSSGPGTIAVRRGNADLMSALKEDKIRYEDSNILARTVNTTWPHRELQEFYVPVSYNPAVEETD